MKYELPVILGAGSFDSKKKFGNIRETSPRTVTTYELEYFFEDGGFSVLNGKKHSLKNGNILFSEPGDIRYSYLPFKCKFIHFSVSDSYLKSAIDNIISFSYHTNLKEIDKTFSHITSLFYSAALFDNITASAELTTLLHLISGHPNENLSITAKAQSFIENNYHDELTTETIANNCNISVSYLHKIFKDTLNLTPGEYLLGCRISAARDMLINTNLSLNEISSISGFSSQSYFSDCFKRKNGLSPKDFRKKNKYMP